MSITAAITLGITIAGFVGGITSAVAKLASKVGRIMEKLEFNEKRDTEERGKTSENFAELYNRVGVTESNINALSTNYVNLNATCNRIENKLDRIIEREVTK